MLTLGTNLKRQSGDTLIEVLFAVTVFSLIVVTSLSLMNQGMNMSQRSLETTLVRQQIDGQAEALRFLHESYIQAYQTGQTFDLTDSVSTPAEEYYRIIQYVTAGGRTVASTFGGATDCVVPSDISKDFVMNPVTAKLINTSVSSTIFQKAATYSQLVYAADGSLSQSQGMWVEAVRSPVNGSNAGYIDFHIRACWNVIGSDIPMNLGTIVRLYEPRS